MRRGRAPLPPQYSLATRANTWGGDHLPRPPLPGWRANTGTPSKPRDATRLRAFYRVGREGAGDATGPEAAPRGAKARTIQSAMWISSPSGGKGGAARW